MKNVCKVVLLLIFSSPPLILGQVKETLKFDSPEIVQEIQAEDGMYYTKVKMTRSSSGFDEGKPDLPTKYVKVLIPKDMDAESVTIDSYLKEDIVANNLVMPVQPDIPTLINYVKQPFVKPEKDSYNKVFPDDIIEIVHQGYYDGIYRIVTLKICPFRYCANKKLLEFYSEIGFTLTYQKSANPRYIVRKNGYSNKDVGRFIINARDIEKLGYKREKLTSGSKTSENLVLDETISTKSVQSLNDNLEFVVITSSQLAPAFNPYVAWKRRKGWNIGIVSVEEIYNNYTSDLVSGIHYNNAARVRQYLVDAFENGLQYVLLGGDYTVVPIMYGCGDNNIWTLYTTDDYKIPTDMYYIDLTGDWHVDGADGDGIVRYGESSDDDPDYNPELYVGRLMCTTTGEIENWLRKLFLYEKNPGNGDYNYLKKALYTQADQMQRDLIAEQVQSNFASIYNTNLLWKELPSYNSKFTDNPPLYFPTGTSVINKLNEHYGLYGQFNHGGPHGIGIATDSIAKYGTNYAYMLAAEDYLDLTQSAWRDESGNGFDNLTNTNYPFYIYSISCETAPLDDYLIDIKPYNINMGEAFTILNNGGPVYLGNSRYGWTSSSKDLFLEFIDHIYDNKFHFGELEAESKGSYINHYLSYSHNLIGCPETEVWTAIPSSFSGVTIYRYIGNSLYVGTGGVGGCRICVMSALDNGASYHEVVDNVASYYFPAPPDPYIVTLTKHNMIPYIKNPDVLYFQNENLTQEAYIYANSFFAGSNVTASKPQGPVKIVSGAHISFETSGDVTLTSDFEVEAGADFEIRK